MHAAVVTAYKDFDMLAALIAELRGRGFLLYVNVDRDSDYTEDQLDELRATCDGVLHNRRIFWGSMSHLRAILDLTRAALADDRVTYVHTLSGQDYPVKPQSTIDAACDGRFFLDVVSLPDEIEMVRARVESYKVLYAIEGVRWLYRPLNKALFLGQRKLGVRRRGLEDIHKGLVWFSGPAPILRDLLAGPDAAQLLRWLRWSYLPEEFYFQTLLMRSPHRGVLDRDNRRYMNWEWRDGNKPAVLDERDAGPVRASTAFFARKFSSQRSKELLRSLAAPARP